MEKKSNIQETFTEIYKFNYWGGSESKSGPGSGTLQTSVVREGLEFIFKQYEIRSILDIPCGDFNWMQRVKMPEIEYIGADIVKEIIDDCSKKYPYRFQVLDITSSKLPKVDLIFSRDCLVHLPYEEIKKALENIKRSGSKYLLTTSFPDHKNMEGQLGGWRPINLQGEPFSLPPPKLILNEGRKDTYVDKSIVLWQVDQL